MWACQGELGSAIPSAFYDIDASLRIDNGQKVMYLKEQDLFTTQYGPNLTSQLSGLYKNTYVS